MAQVENQDQNPVAVLGIERGRHGCKAALLAGGQLHEYWAPSVAAAPSATAEDEGDPLEKIILDGRTWLVGRRALAQSGDGLFRIVGDKTDSDSSAEFRASIAAVLAWASSVADLEQTPIRILTSAPDNEWSRTTDPLKAALIGKWDFAVGAERGWPNGQTRRNLYLTVADAKVAKESVAPLYAHIFDAEGHELPAAENPYADARTLCIGIGFRDWNVAATEGGKISRSKSGRRGVAEIYQALWDTLVEIYPAMGKLADVDDIMQGYRDPTNRFHPIWTRRDPAKVDSAMEAVIIEKGASILDEALQFAGDPETFHRVLVSGGGCLLLQDLVRHRFGSAVSFASVGDGARGLAYRGARWVRTGK